MAQYKPQITNFDFYSVAVGTNWIDRRYRMKSVPKHVPDCTANTMFGIFFVMVALFIIFLFI